MNLQDKSNEYNMKKNDMPILHGHTSILLKNVKTGLVERVESDNTFQGGFVADFMHDSLDKSDHNLYASETFRNDPWKGIVGGLLLFRDAITVGTQFMPAGNVMVGKASNGIVNLSDPPELGSYNDLGSAATGSSISQVFDFSTNQANGTIGCVCLTSREGGLVGYGNGSGKMYAGQKYYFGEMYGRQDGTASGATRGILAENGKRYVFNFDNDSKQLVIRKYRTCGTSIGSVFAGLYTETTHDLTSYPASLITSAAKIINYCGNNVFRIFVEQQDIAPGQTMDYMEYDASTDTLTAKTLLNSSTVTFRTASSYYYAYKSGFTLDGRFVTYNASTEMPLIFDLTTQALILDLTNEITALGLRNNRKGVIQIGNDLYMLQLSNQGGSEVYNAIVDMQNNTLKICDSRFWEESTAGSSYEPGATNFNGKYYQGALIFGGTAITPVVRNPLYLATINNLGTPVTKTAAQTMKVTYTLTEA